MSTDLLFSSPLSLEDFLIVTLSGPISSIFFDVFFFFHFRIISSPESLRHSHVH